MKTNRNGILITGATGYIGYNFSEYIVEKGFDVHLLVRRTSDLNGLENRKNTNIHYYSGKANSIDKIFNEFQIDYVIHLATHYDKSDDPLTLSKLNNVCIDLTSQLLEAIRNQNNAIRFVNVGTIWQSHANFESAYTIYKAFQEELVKLFSIKYGIKSLSLLLNDTYGPGDLRLKLLNQIKSSIVDNNEIKITNPDALIDLVHIADVCEALFYSMSLLVTQDHSFHRYKIQASSPIKIRDLIASIETILGSPIRVIYGTNSLTSKAAILNDIETIPKWEPKVDITSGLLGFFDDKERM